MISKDMSETMSRLVKIEKLVEELLTLRQEMVEFDRKRNYNRECLGAFRRGEIQPSNKLWMHSSTSTLGEGALFVKLPRKNVVTMIEAEQVRLNELIDKNRAEVKARARDLMVLGPDLGSEMDPYVLKLLLQEQKSS